MKDLIEQNLKNPAELEKLYRSNSSLFKKEFKHVFVEHPNEAYLRCWNERLNYHQTTQANWNKNEILFVGISALIAAIISQIPQITGWEQDLFFQRNIAFVVFPGISAYYLWKQNFPLSKIWISALITLISVIYINFLPHFPSDSVTLACLHLPLILWSIMAYAYLDKGLKGALSQKLDFLRLHGDLLVVCAIILLSGGLFTVISLGLFQIIGLDIKEIYGQYVIVSGLSAIPIVGNYLIQNNPALVKNVSPTIAKIFTPIVFVFLFIYLIAMLYTGKDPYTNREFLLIFNGLLVGVMALILFSMVETEKNELTHGRIWLLLGLSILTILVNGIALSAICFRIIEWGITPNRMAVLGSNLLIFIHLILVGKALLKTSQQKSELQDVGKSIVNFIPVYIIWAGIVCFLFPFIFQFK
ncbi:hypothetical protein [Aquirufa rosea]|uniref:DUF4153 domain-containing protein n=1 Tax=Aquirufa rosea TaxID=2509241 RepID=A0A4Q1BZ24_9BACT|nr:hypothetical protein [Aquirufa rosea]RXK48802.1 hypothetical protein ESB04_07540 [Aquirufa rosea]